MKLLNLYMGKHNPVFNRALGDAFECLHIDWMEYGLNSPTLQEHIIIHTKQFQPDYIFLHIQDGNVLTIDTIKELSKMAKVINWTGDVRHPLPQHYIDIGKEIFLTLFSNYNDVETARKSKVKADFLQVGFDDIQFKPVGTINPNYQPILFLGSNYSHAMHFPLTAQREEMVKRLKHDFGQFFGVYGTGWGVASGNITNYQEESTAYRSCRIAINLSHFAYKRYSSDRLFRIMGSGAFCLTHHYPDIEQDFEVGKELVVWNDLDDLVSKINYYLHNHEERSTIALRGCAKAHSKFTWHNFASNLKDLIYKYEQQLDKRNRAVSV
jgi:spore maturation protein CgeB